MCKFSNIDIEYLRKYKINIYGLNIAMFDLFGTLGISYIGAKYYNINPTYVMAGSIPTSIIVHKLFNIKTPLTNLF